MNEATRDGETTMAENPRPRIVTARHSGRCRQCGRTIQAGEKMVLGWPWRHLGEVQCRRPECCGIAAGLTDSDVSRIEQESNPA